METLNTDNLQSVIFHIAHGDFDTANEVFPSSLPKEVREYDHLNQYNLDVMGYPKHSVVKYILDIYTSNAVYKEALEAQNKLRNG